MLSGQALTRMKPEGSKRVEGLSVKTSLPELLIVKTRVTCVPRKTASKSTMPVGVAPVAPPTPVTQVSPSKMPISPPVTVAWSWTWKGLLRKSLLVNESSPP